MPSKDPSPFFTSLEKYKKDLEALEADFKTLKDNVSFLEETDDARTSAEAGYVVIEGTTNKLKVALSSRFALFQRYKIARLAKKAATKTSNSLRAVERRTDEIRREMEEARKADEDAKNLEAAILKAEREAELDRQVIEETRAVVAAMIAELASRTTRPDSPATLGSASTLSTLRAAAPSTESLLTVASSVVSHGVPPAVAVNGQYVERQIADLNKILAELDDSPPVSRTPLYQDPYSQPMHWHNHSENSATLRRLDTPEPPKQSLPPPPRRQPPPPRREPARAENPAFRLGQAGPSRFPGAASQQQPDANHLSNEGQHHAQPSEASFYTAPSRNSHVYAQPAFAQQSFLNLTSESSSEGHGTQGSVLSFDTDVFGSHR